MLRLIKKNNNGLAAALMTALGVLIIFTLSEKLFFGEYTFMHSDLRVLYASFSRLFWSSLFSGRGIDYTFYVSMGMPAIPFYTTYCLSPFNIVYLLIKDIELASVVLVTAKLSLAAFLFQHFLKNIFHENSLGSAAFAAAYALNGYCIAFYFNITFLDGVYMMPLIMELMIRFVKEQKCGKLILAYAYLFIVQFYEGYIIGFFSSLILLLVMVYEYQREWKRYFRCLLKFTAAVVFAALTGAVFLLPTGIFLLENSENTLSFWEIHLNIFDIYNNLFIGQYQNMASEYPYIYCGTAALLLVPLFFADRKIERRIRLLAAVPLLYLFICSLWLPGYQFMHCFDKPDGFGFRFAYFFPFVFLALGFYEWIHLESGSNRKKVWICLFNIIYYVAAFLLIPGGHAVSEQPELGKGLVNILFLIILLLFFIRGENIRKSKILQTFFFVLFWTELIVNGMICSNLTEKNIWERQEVYQAFQEINQQAVEEIKRNDSGIYRIRQVNPYDFNDSALNEYMGLTYFSTVENKRLRNVLWRLGYYTSPRVCCDFGGSDITRMLFSEKYSLDVNHVGAEEEPLWKAHEETLSLGYMVSEDILDVSLDSDNAFENQNKLISAMMGRTMEAFLPYEGEVEGIAENLSVYWDGSSFGIVPEEGEEVGSLVFLLQDEPQMPVYGYLSQAESIIDTTSLLVSTNDPQVRIMFPGMLSVPEIMELSKDENGYYTFTIAFDREHRNNNFYKQNYFCLYDASVCTEVYEQLKEHQMEITEMKGDRIRAEISVDSEQDILFTSIPYDEGWHILIDGQEAEAISVVDQAFLAVKLPEGEHELTFYYSSKINRWGMILSMIGIILWITVCYTEDKRKG